MSDKIGHAWISSLAFSMPMIAFGLALLIGFNHAVLKKQSDGKKPQPQLSQSTGTKQ